MVAIGKKTKLTIKLKRFDSDAKGNLFLFLQLFFCFGHLPAGVLYVSHLNNLQHNKLDFNSLKRIDKALKYRKAI